MSASEENHSSKRKSLAQKKGIHREPRRTFRSEEFSGGKEFIQNQDVHIEGKKIVQSGEYGLFRSI
jgi:hypothetical protein